MPWKSDHQCQRVREAWTSATTWVDQRSSSRTERLLPTNNREVEGVTEPTWAAIQGSENPHCSRAVCRADCNLEQKRINLRGEGPRGRGHICDRHAEVFQSGLQHQRGFVVAFHSSAARWHQQAVRGVPGQKRSRGSVGGSTAQMQQHWTGHLGLCIQPTTPRQCGLDIPDARSNVGQHRPPQSLHQGPRGPSLTWSPTARQRRCPALLPSDAEPLAAWQDLEPSRAPFDDEAARAETFREWGWAGAAHQSRC